MPFLDTFYSFEMYEAAHNYPNVHPAVFFCVWYIPPLVKASINPRTTALLRAVPYSSREYLWMI